MNSTLSFLIAIVFLVIASNFIMLYLRLKKERRPKIGKAAIEENEAVKLRDKEIKRRLDHEQEAAEKHVELRNKTLELYEQVRKNAETKDVSTNR